MMKTSQRTSGRPRRVKLQLTVAGLLAVALMLTIPASASATSAVRPSAPRSVHAVPGNAAVKVSWTHPRTNGGASIKGYVATSHPNGRTCTTSATKCTISGLSNGTSYAFTVVARNKFEVGPRSTGSNRVTPKAPTVNVTFNANGGSGTMANETEADGTTASLTVNTFIRTGYTFEGWNSTASGSGASYANDATYVFAASITLYAQWAAASAPATTPATFNADGGSGTMANETGANGPTAALTPNPLTYSGYTFTGWNTAANGSGASYANGATIAYTTSITLYAQWTVASQTIPAKNQSTNWSGYVVPSSSALITDAQGDRVVPTLNCTDTPNGQIAIWAGIGGQQWATGGSSGSLLQTGIQDNCVNGVQQDHAWWEVVPATPNHEQSFTNFPVSPGDVMQAFVYQTTTGAWQTKVTDVNTGLSAYMITGESWAVGLTSAGTFSIQGSAAGISYAGGYTAEWIVETPTNMSTLGLYPIASFDPVTFTNLRASFTSWQLNQSEAWAIVQSGVTLATPTATSTDGFTVSYTGP